jgi:hypothetical protein
MSLRAFIYRIFLNSDYPKFILKNSIPQGFGMIQFNSQFNSNSISVENIKKK